MVPQHFAVVTANSIDLKPYRSRLVEICVLRFTCNQELNAYCSLVNPEYAVPKIFTKLTGIDRATLSGKPVFCEIAEEILEVLDGAVVLTLEDDSAYRVLCKELKNIGYKFSTPALSITARVQKAYPHLESFQLKNLTEHFNLPNVNLDRPHGRAKAAAALFLQIPKLENEGRPRPIVGLEEAQLKMEALQIRALNRKPGVYYFKDTQDKIIYIGKAVRLRDRVRSHFTNKTAREIQLCEATVKVDFESTGSNLIAELLESDEIKKNRPPFNIAQKGRTAPYIVISSENKRGYLQLSIVRKDYSDSVNEVFYNRNSVAERLMEVCDIFDLCPKLCGFHRIKGKCDHPKFHSCPSACIGEIGSEEYNKRVKKAMTFLQNDLKNFAIWVKGRKPGEMGFVLVRNGIYLGYGFVDMSDQIVSADDFENYMVRKKHTYHTTRIIDSFIRKPRNKRHIMDIDKMPYSN
ncbi:exonuclease domain-containing protein [Pareuzebyella sediminis]|uniref:exonuclease domain-containing protein n=1 Tax=Pareuzebyella sediminis TaxID=2607998 RepID=UPI0011EFA49D|nr:exonuclease domain-containing protein [Pareuzebyella sediminis]